jgi:hypothetical protein|tara:strand:- start:9880 stop:10023 length:144 start_codon:yes stop_codon:yes gene_type:complete
MNRERLWRKGVIADSAPPMAADAGCVIRVQRRDAWTKLGFAPAQDSK